MKRALIIDDTRLARTELLRLLGERPDIQVVGEAENAEQALELIRQHRPDLLFLDIQLPGKNGFELLEDLDEVPEVVFVTAYDDYAVRAFEYNALDYLKKPVSPERLDQALNRLRSPTGLEIQQSELLTEESRVFVKDGERCWFVHLKEVRLLEVMDSYTRIYFESFSPMIPRSLNYMESRLDQRIFFRANRQQIVNTKWIDRIDPWFSGTLRLTLRDGSTVEVSRRQTIRFKELMSF